MPNKHQRDSGGPQLRRSYGDHQAYSASHEGIAEVVLSRLDKRQVSEQRHRAKRYES